MVEDLFNFNENANIVEEIVNGSIMYTIDNFYKNPEKILQVFYSIPAQVHKKQDTPSHNQVYFDDRRHSIKTKLIVPAYKFLEQLCGQKSVHGTDKILTNLTRFKKDKFNDYHCNYWWPHYDSGYTAILYLNDDDKNGTNLYQELIKNNTSYSEHYMPWICKANYNLIKSIKPGFNKLVLFDAKLFCHGMNICDDRYFNEIYRINQVFFFSNSAS